MSDNCTGLRSHMHLREKHLEKVERNVSLPFPAGGLGGRVDCPPPGPSSGFSLGEGPSTVLTACPWVGWTRCHPGGRCAFRRPLVRRQHRPHFLPEPVLLPGSRSRGGSRGLHSAATAVRRKDRSSRRPSRGPAQRSFHPREQLEAIWQPSAWDLRGNLLRARGVEGGLWRWQEPGYVSWDVLRPGQALLPPGLPTGPRTCSSLGCWLRAPAPQAGQENLLVHSALPVHTGVCTAPSRGPQWPMTRQDSGWKAAAGAEAGQTLQGHTGAQQRAGETAARLCPQYH